MNIAIIGGGNMGSILIGGLLKSGHPVNQLCVCDPDANQCAYLTQIFSIPAYSDNQLGLAQADVVIFAIKPQVFAKVAIAVKDIIQQRKPLVISIAAGIRETSIQRWLGGKVAIIRAMPNTPALLGVGATALYANTFVSPAERTLADSILCAVGIAEWLPDESLMDTVTALSGSGPAYFFLVMEAMQQAAEELGLPAATARLLTQQTALGAAQMACASELPLAALRQQVSSPGGTTEKAISVLEDQHLRQIFKQALCAAKLRSEELATQLGDLS